MFPVISAVVPYFIINFKQGLLIKAHLQTRPRQIRHIYDYKVFLHIYIYIYIYIYIHIYNMYYNIYNQKFSFSLSELDL